MTAFRGGNAKGPRASSFKAGDKLKKSSSKLKAYRYNKETGKHDEIDIPDSIERYSPKGRTLRKAFERPRPDLPSDAPVNRTKKQVALTLPPDLLDQVNEEVKKRGIDRNLFIERALRDALQPK